MNVLETFVILFKSNAEDVRKGAKEATKAGDELEKKLSDTGKVTEGLGQSFMGLASAAAGAIAGYFAIGAIKDGTLHTAQFNAELEKQSRLIGINADDLSAWGAAVERAGGNSGEFVSWLSALNLEYSKMGIGDRVKNIPENLLKLADKFSKMNIHDALREGTIMGIPESVILALHKGRGELEALIEAQRGLAPLTNENANTSRELVNALGDLGRSVMPVYNAFGNVAVPVLTYSAKALRGVIELTDNAVSAIGDTWDDVQKNYDNFSGKAVEAGKTIERVWSGIADKIKPVTELLQRGIDALERFIGSNLTKALSFLGIEPIPMPKPQKGVSVSNSDGIKIDAPYPNKPSTQKANAPYPYQDAPEWSAAVSEAQRAIGKADKMPLASQTTNKSVTKNVNVTTGQITIHTQATDVDGIADALSSNLNDQYRSAIGNWDDGIDR